MATNQIDRMRAFKERLQRENVQVLPDAAPLVTRDVKECPASFAQHRLWLTHRLQPESPFYNVTLVASLRGRLDLEALEHSLQRIVERHSALRTYFETRAGKPYQIVADVFKTRLKIHDLQSEEGPPDEGAVRRKVESIGAEPFDLSKAPLFRFHLLRLQRDENIIVLGFHHIIIDHQSERVFLEELGDLYRSQIRGAPANLDPLRFQYSDYSEYQRERLSGSHLSELLDYWKQRVGEGESIPDVVLPFRRKTDTSFAFQGSVVSSRLEGSAVDSLRKFALAQNKSLFALTLAAFGILLHKYTRSEDILITFPASNRDKLGLEKLIGFFVNLVVLRVRIDENLTVQETLGRIWSAYLESIEHQELPFEKLVEAVDPKRYHGATRLSQNVFGYRRLSKLALELDDLVIVPKDFESQHAKFELSLLAVLQYESLDINFEFNRECYDEADIRRMCSNYLHLLQNLPEIMNRRLKDLPMVSPEERNTQLIEWNGAAPTRTKGSSLLERLDQACQASPDAIAVLGADGHASYGGLHRSANQWARFLRAKGAGPEVLIGLCIERSVTAVASMLGILKSGGAYVALDSQSPPVRLRQIVEETGLRILLCRGPLKIQLESAGVDCIIVDVDAEERALRAGSARRVDPGVAPENLAYVLMTSGSSGRPKGVMVSHGNLLNSTLDRLDFYSGRVERFLLLSPLYFDSSVAGLYWTLFQGGCIVLPEEGQQRDIQFMGALCELENISHLLCIPSLYRLLLEELKERRQLNLRKTIVAGEVCGAELTARHAETFGDIELFNEYGPTEGTVWCTGSRVDVGPHEDPVPIGRSTGSMRTYALDGLSQLLVAGARGEICIGGGGVARGYWGRRAETAERFIPDAHGDRPGGRLYRSGDRGRWRGDGQLLYEGRSDDEVKIRGYRVALGEVESALQEHPAVEDAVVVALEGSQPQLIGFAVLKDGAGDNGEQLRAHVRTRLPEPMTPARVHLLTALPQLPNGKVDRKRLATLESEFHDVSSGLSAAKGPVENLIADAWSEVLGREHVGLDENFFDIGGHSLLATQVVSRMQTIFNSTLSLQNLFENPTVRKLSAFIQLGENTEKIAVAAPEIKAVSHNGQPTPISLQQQRLWFLWETSPGSIDYNLPRALRLRGPLDTDALQRSIREIRRRHQVLRSTFYSLEGRPFTRLNAADQWELVVEELEPGLGEDLEVVADRIESEVRKPFALDQELMRILLFRFGDDDHVLFFNMHHIISDGWSLGILIRELHVLYNAYSKGTSSPLPELTLQYSDYARWQRQWMRGEVLEGYLDFWESALKGTPESLPLPFKPGAPTEERFAGRPLHFETQLEVLNRLRSLCRETATTLFMALESVFAACLAWYSGSRDIVIGTSVANRREASLEPLIGFFANTLILRSNLEGDVSFRAVLQSAREFTLKAFAHQEVPLESLVARLRDKKGAASSGIFEAFFVLHNEPVDDFSLQGLESEFLDISNPTTMFKLSLSMAERESGLWYMLHYDSNYFDAETIGDMGETIDRIIRAILEDPDRPLFDLLSEKLQVSLPSIL